MVRCGAAPWRQLAAADHLLRIIGCGGGGGAAGWQGDRSILIPMLQHGSGQSMASCHLRSHLTSLAAPRPGLATSEQPWARASRVETKVPPVRSGAGRCGLPEIGRLGAVTYRARQDRAGIVRSRKRAVGWAGRGQCCCKGQRPVSSLQIWGR